MIKYILGVIVMLVIGGVVSINMSINSQKVSNLSSISLSNIEVLADVVVEITIKKGDTCNKGAWSSSNARAVCCDDPCRINFNSSALTGTCP
jgi:hypothetical protein